MVPSCVFQTCAHTLRLISDLIVVNFVNPATGFASVVNHHLANVSWRANVNVIHYRTATSLALLWFRVTNSRLKMLNNNSF